MSGAYSDKGLCSCPSFLLSQESRFPAPGQALRLRSAQGERGPFVLSGARQGGVEAWMPDHVRHDGSPLHGENLV